MSPEEKAPANSIEKVYLEASHWVRLANQVVWQMGTFLVPFSFTLIGLALNKSTSLTFDDKGRTLLGVGSVFVFSFWVYTTFLYRHSAATARDVLVKIEKEWGIPAEMSLYTRHGKIGLQWYSLYNLQVLALVLLIVVWIVILTRHI